MDRLQEIQAILADDAQRAALTDEQIDALEAELLSLFDDVRAGKIDGVTRNDTAKLREIADVVAGVRGETKARIDAAAKAAAEEAEREAEAERIAAELRPAPVAETPPETPEPEPAPVEPEPAPEPEVPAEPAAPVAEVPVLEPVGAAAIAPAAPAPAPQAPLAAAMSHVPAVSQPAARIENVKPRWEVGRGEFVDWPELVERVMEAHESFGTDDYFGPDQKIRVGRVRRAYEPERDLSAESGANQRTIEQRLGAILDDAYDPRKWDEALVASGGFCAPPAVAYDFPSISQADRPVWDYLPKFRADRGALMFMTPFGISSISVSNAQTAGAAVSVWTNTIDTTPGGTTKPKQTIACPAQQTVTLQAVVQQLQIGNFLGRALPELVSKFMHEVDSAHARLAETLNLADIDAASNAMTVAKLLGATPDLVMSVRQAAARYRNNQRMAPNARLRLLLPAWMIDFIAADVSQRHAGDGLDIFTVNDAWVRALFSNMNVNVTFYEDAASLTSTQILGPQGPTDIRNWPLTVVMYLFHEGAFLGLDGGTLDVGIVRDSTLNGTNNYQIFSESFEKVAFRGLESQKITQTICPTGQGALDVTGLTCSAS